MRWVTCHLSYKSLQTTKSLIRLPVTQTLVVTGHSCFQTPRALGRNPFRRKKKPWRSGDYRPNYVYHYGGQQQIREDEVPWRSTMYRWHNWGTMIWCRRSVDFGANTWVILGEWVAAWGRTDLRCAASMVILTNIDECWRTDLVMLRERQRKTACRNSSVAQSWHWIQIGIQLVETQFSSDAQIPGLASLPALSEQRSLYGSCSDLKEKPFTGHLHCSFISFMISWLFWITILTWSSESHGCPRFSILNAVLVNHPLGIAFGGSAWPPQGEEFAGALCLGHRSAAPLWWFCRSGARQCSRAWESGWTSSFCHASMAYCNNYILYIRIYIYIYTYLNII